jgi:hypothetical protein
MAPEKPSYPTHPAKRYESLKQPACNSWGLANRAISWQAIVMGNKDARGREKKKPKKAKAERVVVSLPPRRIVKETPEIKPQS